MKLESLTTEFWIVIIHHGSKNITFVNRVYYVKLVENLQPI